MSAADPALTLTQALAQRVRAFHYDLLSEQARDLARAVFVDGMAAALAGAAEPSGIGSLIREYVGECEGASQASVIAGGYKASMTDAAFANGTMAHALDFDNTSYPTNHPTSPTLPAILAAAEHFGFSGRDCLVALVTAFEVQGRLRLASPGLHSGYGFHKPGTIGLMGAVAAAIRLFDLDARQAAMAFGIAGSRAGSLSSNSGSMTKATHSGHAARMGLESAMLARKGWTANPDVFGENGFFDAFVGEEQEPALLIQDFGEPLYLLKPGVGFKKFPSNYFTHRPIEAALQIRETPGFDLDRLEQVTVHFPDVRYVDRPQPASGLEGKFSVQYVTALALLDGRLNMDSFTDERRFAPDLERLLPTITIEYDMGIPKEFLEMYVVVEVLQGDGTKLSARVEALTGMPGVPLTREERRDKFFSCALRVLKPNAAQELLDLLEAVDSQPDVCRMMDLARSGV